MLLIAAAPSLAEDAADLVLRNGRFYPVATPGVVEGSLAVRDGRIAYLGPDAGAAGFDRRRHRGRSSWPVAP